MRSILVVGSCSNTSDDQFVKLAENLGRAVVSVGYRLVTGGSNAEDNVDLHAARGAAAECDERSIDLEEHVLSIAREEMEVHGIGRIRNALGNGPIAKRYSLVHEASAVIVLGGSEATEDYIYLCEKGNRPVVPIPMLEGASRRLYERYSENLPLTIPEFVNFEDFNNVNRRLDNEKSLKKAAEDAVSLARKCFSGTNVIFVATPFETKFNNVLGAIKTAANNSETDYFVLRIDETKGTSRIDDEIEKQIQNASVVVADLTGLNPNVFYEFGFARASNVMAISIAEKKTELPFNIQSLRTIFYDPNDLQKLTDEIVRFLPDSSTTT